MLGAEDGVEWQSDVVSPADAVVRDDALFLAARGNRNGQSFLEELLVLLAAPAARELDDASRFFADRDALGSPLKGGGNRRRKKRDLDREKDEEEDEAGEAHHLQVFRGLLVATKENSLLQNALIGHDFLIGRPSNQDLKIQQEQMQGSEEMKRRSQRRLWKKKRIEELQNQENENLTPLGEHEIKEMLKRAMAEQQLLQALLITILVLMTETEQEKVINDVTIFTETIETIGIQTLVGKLLAELAMMAEDYVSSSGNQGIASVHAQPVTFLLLKEMLCKGGKTDDVLAILCANLLHVSLKHISPAAAGLGHSGDSDFVFKLRDEVLVFANNSSLPRPLQARAILCWTLGFAYFYPTQKLRGEVLGQQLRAHDKDDPRATLMLECLAGCLADPTFVIADLHTMELLMDSIEEVPEAARLSAERPKLEYRQPALSLSADEGDEDEENLLQQALALSLTEQEFLATSFRRELLRTSQELYFQLHVDPTGASGSPEQEPSLTLQEARCAETIELSNGDTTATQKSDKEWGTALAHRALTNDQRIYKWSVRLNKCEKGHIFIGVATASATTGTYLGGDKNGWGLIGTKILWHNRTKLRSYGTGFKTGDIVTATLNTEAGTLSYQVNNKPDAGVAFRNLADFCIEGLFPAVALYQRGDSVTFLDAKSAALAIGASPRTVAAAAGESMSTHRAITSKPPELDQVMDRFNERLCRDDLVMPPSGYLTMILQRSDTIKRILIEKLLATIVLWPHHSLSVGTACDILQELLQNYQALSNFADSFHEESDEVFVSGEWKMVSRLPLSQVYEINLKESNGRISCEDDMVNIDGFVTGGNQVAFTEVWSQTQSKCHVCMRIMPGGNVMIGSYTDDLDKEKTGSIFAYRQGKETACTPAKILHHLVGTLIGKMCAVIFKGTSDSVAVEDDEDGGFVLEGNDDGSNEEDEQQREEKDEVNDAASDFQKYLHSSVLAGGLSDFAINAFLKEQTQRVRHGQLLMTLSGYESSFSSTSFGDSTEWGIICPKDVAFLQALVNFQDAEDPSTSVQDPGFRSIEQFDQWMLRFAGKSAFLDVGGSVMKPARMAATAAMLSHTGVLQEARLLSLWLQEDNHDKDHDGVQPSRMLISIWRSTQRIIEWAIRQKQHSGATFGALAEQLVNRARFLLRIRPSAIPHLDFSTGALQKSISSDSLRVEASSSSFGQTMIPIANLITADFVDHIASDDCDCSTLEVLEHWKRLAKYVTRTHGDMMTHSESLESVVLFLKDTFSIQRLRNHMLNGTWRAIQKAAAFNLFSLFFAKHRDPEISIRNVFDVGEFKIPMELKESVLVWIAPSMQGLDEPNALSLGPRFPSMGIYAPKKPQQESKQQKNRKDGSRSQIEAFLQSADQPSSKGPVLSVLDFEDLGLVQPASTPSTSSASAFGLDSSHFLFDTRGCGKHLQEVVRDAFEQLYSTLAADLERSATAGSVNMQLGIINAWNISLAPDDHVFLSKVGIFRIFHQILTAARANLVSLESEPILNPALGHQQQIIMKTTLQVVHILATQVVTTEPAPSIDTTSFSIKSPTASFMNNLKTHVRPAGAETLGKAVFEMLFHEMEVALESVTEEEYCFQVVLLLYTITVNGLRTSVEYLAIPSRMETLLHAADSQSPRVQHRVIRLLGRLLPNLKVNSLQIMRDYVVSRLLALVAQAYPTAEAPESSYFLHVSRACDVIALLRRLLNDEKGIWSEEIQEALSRMFGQDDPKMKWTALCVLGGVFDPLRTCGKVRFASSMLRNVDDSLLGDVKQLAHRNVVLVAKTGPNQEHAQVLMQDTSLPPLNVREGRDSKPREKSRLMSATVDTSMLIPVPEVPLAFKMSDRLKSVMLSRIPSYLAEKAEEGQETPQEEVSTLSEDDFRQAATSKLEHSFEDASLMKALAAMGNVSHDLVVASFSDLLSIASKHTKTCGIRDLPNLETWYRGLTAGFALLQQELRSKSGSCETPEDVSGDEEEEEMSPELRTMLDYGMGFPKEVCQLALERCNNDIEAAIEFCIEHNGDIEVLVEAANRQASSRRAVIVEKLAEMGFPERYASRAIDEVGENFDNALTWILGNGDLLKQLDEEAEQLENVDASRPSESEDLDQSTGLFQFPPGVGIVSATSGVDAVEISPSLKVSVRSSATGFPSVGARDLLLRSGQWYYEVTLFTENCMQIGWADASFTGNAADGDGVGDDGKSWSFDGYRQLAWHARSKTWGRKWKKGDVVCVAADLGSGDLWFGLNGDYSGDLGMMVSGLAEGKDYVRGLYPAASLNRTESLEFNFGNKPFKFQAPVELSNAEPVAAAFDSKKNNLAHYLWFDEVGDDVAKQFHRHLIEDCLEEEIPFLGPRSVVERYFPNEQPADTQGGTSSSSSSARSSRAAESSWRGKANNPSGIFSRVGRSSGSPTSKSPAKGKQNLKRRKFAFTIDLSDPDTVLEEHGVEPLNSAINDQQSRFKLYKASLQQISASLLVAGMALRVLYARKVILSLFIQWKSIEDVNKDALLGAIGKSGGKFFSVIKLLASDDIGFVDSPGDVANSLSECFLGVLRDVLNKDPSLLENIVSLVGGELARASMRIFASVDWKQADHVQKLFADAKRGALGAQLSHSAMILSKRTGEDVPDENEAASMSEDAPFDDFAVSQLPNLHLVLWFSKFLRTYQSTNNRSMVRKVFAAWSLTLRSPSVHLKALACRELCDILDESKANQHLMEKLWKMCPMDRIKKVAERHISCDGVTSPLHSDYVQALVELAAMEPSGPILQMNRQHDPIAFAMRDRDDMISPSPHCFSGTFHQFPIASLTEEETDDVDFEKVVLEQVRVGDLVVRGPAWDAGDEDGGGPGNLGSVVAIEGSEVKVRWNSKSIEKQISLETETGDEIQEIVEQLEENVTENEEDDDEKEEDDEEDEDEDEDEEEEEDDDNEQEEEEHHEVVSPMLPIETAPLKSYKLLNDACDQWRLVVLRFDPEVKSLARLDARELVKAHREKSRMEKLKKRAVEFLHSSKGLDKKVARLGSRLRLGCQLWLADDMQSGSITFPDLNAEIAVSAMRIEDGVLELEEQHLVLGSATRGWESRFGSPRWRPGTKYKLKYNVESRSWSGIFSFEIPERVVKASVNEIEARKKDDSLLEEIEVKEKSSSASDERRRRQQQGGSGLAPRIFLQHGDSERAVAVDLSSLEDLGDADLLEALLRPLMARNLGGAGGGGGEQSAGRRAAEHLLGQQLFRRRPVGNDESSSRQSRSIPQLLRRGTLATASIRSRRSDSESHSSTSGAEDTTEDESQVRLSTSDNAASLEVQKMYEKPVILEIVNETCFQLKDSSQKMEVSRVWTLHQIRASLEFENADVDKSTLSLANVGDSTELVGLQRILGEIMPLKKEEGEETYVLRLVPNSSTSTIDVQDLLNPKSENDVAKLVKEELEQPLLVAGTLEVSQTKPFELNSDSKGTSMILSNENQTVTLSQFETDSRGLALSRTGFTSGVHYWEVKVDQASQEYGSVFVGVSERPLGVFPAGTQMSFLRRWDRSPGAYGFVNFRATLETHASQPQGIEQIYGEFYGTGDTVGIFLDMDRGIISFFIDGIKYGQHTMKDLGIAFSSGQISGKADARVDMSAPLTLYPVVGLRRSRGNAVTLTQKYFSIPRRSPNVFLRDISWVSKLLRNTSLTKEEKGLHAPELDDELVKRSFAHFNRWKTSNVRQYPCRARGLMVEVDVSPEACERASGDQVAFEGGRKGFRAGDRVRILLSNGRDLESPEEAVVLGVHEGRLWYRVESQQGSGHEGMEEGASYAWYWNPEELPLLEVVQLVVNGATGDGADDKVPCFESVEDFRKSLESNWSPDDDRLLVQVINERCNVLGVEPINLILPQLLEKTEDIEAAFSGRFAKKEVVARASMFRVINCMLKRVLPFVSLQGSLGRCLSRLRGLIFTWTKKSFWENVLLATTTHTPLATDEYEDPAQIRMVNVNRIQAAAPKLAMIRDSELRFRRSVFGQLYSEMIKWSDHSLRRAYVGKGHGGQKRSFKVKFLGEGVKDYGGPYRATFEEIADELQNDQEWPDSRLECLLPLFLPCPNRYNSTGDAGRDKFVFNPGEKKLKRFIFLGKLVGMAVRHGLQMGLDLPTFYWSWLAKLDISPNQLEEIDKVFTNSLQRILQLVASGMNGAEESGDASASLSELLGEELFCEVTLSDSFRVETLADGKSTPVTRENAAAHVEKAQKLRLFESIESLEAFRSGLSSVVPVELFSLFSERELESLLCGQKELDLTLLKQCTEYEGVDANDPHIKMFWEVLQEMTGEQRTEFLRFAWARSRMPDSAVDMPMNFVLTSPTGGAVEKPDDYLPTAQTCFFSLSLPKYSNKEVMKDKLLYAIKCTLMDNDYLSRSAEGWAS